MFSNTLFQKNSTYRWVYFFAPHLMGQMLSECATLLRDIRFGIRFFGEKGRKFFFYS